MSVDYSADYQIVANREATCWDLLPAALESAQMTRSWLQ